MATEIKITLHPETFQSLVALLQMARLGGTDTRDGEGKRAFLDLMANQGRKLIDPNGNDWHFPEVLAMVSEQILRDIGIKEG